MTHDGEIHPIPSSDGSAVNWEQIAPEWLVKYSETFKRFGKSPVAFVLGAILNVLLGGVEAIVRALADAFFAVFVGSKPMSTEGVYGLADIPLLALEVLMAGGQFVGGMILSSIRAYTTGAVEFALSFGMFSPLILTAEVVVVIVLTYVAATTLLRIAADAIPGLGGIVR